MKDITLDFDYDEIRVETMFDALSPGEKAIMLGKLLGPMSNAKVLTNREAGMLFCNIAREASVGSIAKDFSCSESLVYAVLSKAANKIKEARGVLYSDTVH